jgi:hypothetical protein
MKISKGLIDFPSRTNSTIIKKYLKEYPLFYFPDILEY